MKNSYQGLTKKEIPVLFERYGLNVIPEKKPTSKLFLLFSQFKSFLVILLIFSAIVSILLRETIDAIFIFFIVLLNALIGFFQEVKADNDITALKRMVISEARVIRDGREQKIETKNLLPDDLVILEAGDKVPADGKIVSGKNILLNEAALTGESVPVEKNPGDLIFMSTDLLSGKATMIITATGSETRFGKLAFSLTQIPDDKTPLELKISSLSKKLGLIIIFIITLVMLVGYVQGREIYFLFFTAIALAVAAIPEGLPTVLTITLAIGIRRLAKKNAVVKKLVTAETLGIVDVICTDKTGTLTKNEMTAKKIITADKNIYEISGAGFNFEGKIKRPEGLFEKNIETDKNLQKIFQASAVCNSSALSETEQKNYYRVLGDTTEGALLIMAKKGGVDYERLRQELIISEEISFDSERRLMTVVVNNQEIYCKGAPDKILEICNLAESEKEYFNKFIKSEAGKGYRLLGFAAKKYNHNSVDDLENNLQFMGIVAIFDPPREEVKQSIRACQKAGIKVVMITGDYPETARAVGEQINLFVKGDEIITGDQLDLYSAEILSERINSIKIFARTTPQQKLKIVEAFQNQGLVVAVTGDGVNDAPALKKAQIGVAMGITGTDVAKETADVIITDDNFTTIVTAVREGRTIYLNLVKAIKYLLACNLGEVVLVFFAILFGLSLPLSPLAILWLNVVTDGLPALAFSFDKSDQKILSQSHHELKIGDLLNGTNFIPIAAIGLLLGISSLLIFIITSGSGVNQARLITFTYLVVGELLLTFIVRGKQKLFANKFLILTVFFSLIIQLFIVAVPQIREIFI